MQKSILRLFLFCTALLAVSPAFAGDFLVVPGLRIGTVVLNMSRQAIHRTLHRPRFARRLPNDIVEESWLIPLPPTQQHSYYDDGRYWKYFFVNIYFRRGHVAQVEVNSPVFKTAGDLSVNRKAVLFQREYRPYHSSNRASGEPLRYGTRDQAGGFPGYKHFVTIEDAVRDGIAWRYGSWGDLAPDPDPSHLEVIIVHPRGRRVLLESDAGNRFVLTLHRN